ncbi:hypothetical protein TSUD_54270 [Trifolium subterraneum]|uniref:Bifunctional inhibitor/plant lipid transfer protein/seed storage helical domain-containing protein n=1 Tax=Trifolium subterraneum TaxID=3900 RepID=A0A2Z6N400_TRISU|nr:hypothetical protein TSUD_54270 [Trifolium subterraneum]
METKLLKIFLMFVVFLVAITGTGAIGGINDPEIGLVCCPDFKDLCIRPACYNPPYCCLSLPSK